MTTFIKGKLKKSDDQTTIDKYRVAAANITEYHYSVRNLSQPNLKNDNIHKNETNQMIRRILAI